MIVGLWENGNNKDSWSRACLVQWYELGDFRSLRSRRLEVVDERENGRARGSFSRALFFLCPLLPSAYDFRGLVKGVGLNIGMGGVSW